jgi:predicted enzyme related to lactoylglutathione lyase/plasmid maintenance system antidote protein VapI
MKTPPPSTFRALLRSELARRCAHNERYSMRAFARQLDIDPATLSQLLRGRRALTPQTVEHLGRAIGLDDATIADLAREAARARSDTAEARAPGVAHVAAAIAGDPVHHELLALVSTDDFRADVRWIARVLDTTVDAIQLAVQRLAQFELLALGPGSDWRDLAGAGDLPPDAFEDLVWTRALALSQRSERPGDSNHEPASARSTGHPVGRFQIISGDPDGAARFYGDVFGWVTSDDNALGARQIDTRAAGPGGGLWPAPPGVQGFVQLLVSVDDVPAMVERAAARGATVLVPPQVLPDGDEMAVLRDPQGIPFGVYRAA